MSKASELLQKPYRRVIVPEADGTFRGEILEFPGCIATGETRAATLDLLEEVAESWLESMLANRNKIPEPLENMEFSGKLVLRLPKSLHAKSAYAARADGVSLNQFIVTCVSEHVGARSVAATPTTAGGLVFNISAGTGPSLIYEASTAGLRLVPGQHRAESTSDVSMYNSAIVYAGRQT